MAETPEAELAPQDHGPDGRRRRTVLALWAVLAVLAVGIGAVAVGAGDDDPPRLPIALGDSGAGGARAEADTMAADASMMAWVRYVAGEDLPALGGSAAAHRLSNDVDPDRLRAMADVLGLDGEPVEQPESKGSWQLTSSDGSTLGAGPYSGGMWWYTSGALLADQGGGSTGSSASCPADDAKRCEERAREADAASEQAAVPPECPASGCAELPVEEEPEPFVPPADLPSKAEAEEIALDLFRRLGADVDGARVTVEGPHDAWYVSLEPLVDGLVVSGHAFNATVGPKGAVLAAGGVLNGPDRLGDYPTVDTRAAVDRLNEQSAGFGDGREPAIAEDASSHDVDCAAATTDAATSDELLVDPACDGGPPPEPTEIVLHEAERILLVVPSFDESSESYLVPGYRMRGDDGAQVDVIAVDDDSLVPPPSRPQQEPAGDPVPADDPTSVDGSPACAPVEPGPDGAVPDICLSPDHPTVTETTPRDGADPSAPVSDPDAPVESPPVGEG